MIDMPIDVHTRLGSQYTDRIEAGMPRLVLDGPSSLRELAATYRLDGNSLILPVIRCVVPECQTEPAVFSSCDASVQGAHYVTARCSVAGSPGSLDLGPKTTTTTTT
jgi:hypothetical protein